MLCLEIKAGNVESCEEAIEFFVENARDVVIDDNKGLLLFNQVDDLIEEFVANMDVLLCTKCSICSNVRSPISPSSINSAMLCAKKCVELIHFMKENLNEHFAFNM